MSGDVNAAAPHSEWANLHQANLAIARLQAEVKELREQIEKVARRARATAYETDPLNRIG